MGAGLSVGKAVANVSKKVPKVTNVVSSTAKEPAQAELEWAWEHGPYALNEPVEGDWHLASRGASLDIKLPAPK